MSVHLEPASQLTFRRPLTQVSKELLLVTNPGNDPVMFKVKTTAPKQYCVRPNAGRIEPRSQVEVQVILQPFKEEPPADFKCKDKFLVQTTIIKPVYEALPIAEMWSIAEAEDRSSIFQQKIKCVFLPPALEEKTLPSEKLDNTNEPQQQHLPEPPVVPVPAPPAPVVEDAPVAHVVKEEPNQPQLEPLATAAAAAAAIPVVEPETVPIQPQPAIPAVAPAPAPASVDLPPEPKSRSISPPVPQSRVIEEKPKSIATTATDATKPASEDSEKKRLEEDLRASRALVDQLKSQIAALQKEQEAGRLSRKLAPTVQPLDAVHQHLAALEKPQVPEGYPPQVVLIVAGLVFLFTYLFF